MALATKGATLKFQAGEAGVPFLDFVAQKKAAVAAAKAAQEEEEGGIPVYVYAGAGVAVLGLVGLFIYLRKKKGGALADVPDCGCGG